MNPEWLRIIWPLIGAILSIIGGFVAVVIRSRMEKKQEIDYIKIGLCDELGEICEIIKKLTETGKRTKIIPPEYLADLESNTEAFVFHKPKLFIISVESLRKEITAFYKDLKEKIEGARNSVGSLSIADESISKNITTEFDTVMIRARDLKDNIGKFKYRVWWFNRWKK